MIRKKRLLEFESHLFRWFKFSDPLLGRNRELVGRAAYTAISVPYSKSQTASEFR
jgi:hypothetical protein